MAANTNANDSDDLEDLDYGDDDFDLESRTDQSQISGTRTSTQEADDDDDEEHREDDGDENDDDNVDDDDEEDNDDDGQEDETSDNNLLGESYELNAHELESFRPRRHKLEEPEQPNVRGRGLKRKNRDDEDEEAEQNCDQSKNGDKSNVERCKFWPYCTAGDKCSFYHPTKPCRTFPNCRFGSNCLYIHPPCKFLPFCTRSDCPFAHPAKQTSAIRGHHRALLACAASTTTTTAAAATTNTAIIGRPQLVAPTPMASHFRSQPPPPPVAIQQQPTVPKCKFGFKCSNLMCKFSHQATEPCRYGANCLLENCAFTHPTDQQSQQQKKSSNVFKWTAKS